LYSRLQEAFRVNYYVALSPDLEICKSEFVTSWNESPECVDVALAETKEATQESFAIDPALLGEGLIYLAGVGSTIAVGVLKDLIKDFIERKLAKKGEALNVVVIVIEKSDIPLVVVKGQGK